MSALKLLRGSLEIDSWKVEHSRSMSDEVAQGFADVLNSVEEM